MVRGLVRKNNLSDLENAERARINLGLVSADYNRIRGLYTSAGVTNVDVQRIGRSASNYQQQINLLSASLSGIIPSLYVARSGDTITSGWTNQGYIQPGSLVQSGTTLSGSSDSLFTLTVPGLSYSLSTSSLLCNLGLTVQGLADNGDNVVFASGVVPDKRVPINIKGIPYFLEAG